MPSRFLVRVPSRSTLILRTLARVAIAGATLIAGPRDLAAQQAPASAQATPVRGDLDTRLAEAFARTRGRDTPLPEFVELLTEAERNGTPRQIADALRGIAINDARTGRYQESLPGLDRAIALYLEAADPVNAARAQRMRGVARYYAGRQADALADLRTAEDVLARLGEPRDLLAVYSSLVYVADAGPEFERARVRGLELARTLGEAVTEGTILHAWGDSLFEHGDYRQAHVVLMQAVERFETGRDFSRAGRALISLGRIFRAHNQLDRALSFYERALAIHERARDVDSALQDLNAIAVTLSRMGLHEMALATYEKALAYAKSLDAQRTITFQTGNIGSEYLKMGRAADALVLLRQAFDQEKQPTRIALRASQIAGAYEKLGDLEKAREWMDRTLELSAGFPPEQRLSHLWQSANLNVRTGRTEIAERELNDARTQVEALRRTLIPLDFMKRGFSDANQEWFSLTIDLLSRRGEHARALEAAEHARARAFLDLLASRAASQPTSTTTAVDASKPAPVPTPPAASSGSTSSASAAPPAGSTGAARAPGLSLRGGTSSGEASPGTIAAVAAHTLTGQDLALESTRTAHPASVDDMVRTARRLRSTLVVYWVAAAKTTIWVVDGTGRVEATSVDVAGTKLRELVAASTAGFTANGEFSGFAALGRSQTRPWRDLYRLLVEPIRPHLPRTSGSLLTIVPHGPLFRLSFAALQSSAGRYLIEDYRLHYASAAGVLDFTATRPHDAALGARGAMLVGDPGELPGTFSDEVLPALPWARAEVSSIEPRLGSAARTVLVGSTATERNVRDALSGRSLIHFATHGIVQDEQAASSYLALRGDGTTGADDGRLTTTEIYDLKLDADLVVLSACRSALGPTSGDGIIGFTRAFLYAGAARVMATAWDVPDEAGYRLMRDFYRFRAQRRDASAALRDAQLAVLAGMRKGTLTWSAGSLPEHPIFWAGFIVVGEP